MFSYVKPRAIGPKWVVIYSYTQYGERHRLRTRFSGPRTWLQAFRKALWMADSGNGEKDIVIESLERDGKRWYRGHIKERK
jgi:hypothetical protein